MTDPKYFLTKTERAEMMRAQVGLVTALIAKDDEALDAQLRAILADHATASGGDVKVFSGRMAKQVEIGAVMSRHILMSLAPRLNMSEAEVNELFASTYADPSIIDLFTD